MQSFKVKCDSCQAMAVNGIGIHEIGCYGRMIFTDHRGREYLKFQVWSLDVWGNKRDGFEVNDRQKCEVIIVRDDLGDKGIIKALKEADLLNKKCHFKSFNVDEYGLEAAKTGEPIYQLEIL